MSAKKKILLVYANFSTFVKQDYEILSEDHEVTRYHFVHSKKPLAFLWQFVKQLIYLLFKGWRYDAFFIWFADYHSLLPVWFAKLAGKKSLVVIGGYDAARIRKLKYGVFYKKIRGFFAIQSIANSSKNLCVSSHIHRIISHISPNSKNLLIYNCVNITSTTAFEKGNIVLTVAIINNEKTFYIKGIDLFIDAARTLQNYEFQIIGIEQENIKSLLVNLPPNLTLIGLLPHEKLADYYLKAKVYCQLSLIESFCVVLAEAMSFNCYPVTTNAGGMVEVAGRLGTTVKRDLPHIIEAINKGMKSPLTDQFKKHITSSFSFEKRRNELQKLLFQCF